MGQVENTIIEKKEEVALDGNFEWLTDHSVKYLEAGYLSKGVAPKVRIREIANRAEEILGIEGYADKFYNYMSQGFFSLASPVWSNFGKKRGLPISCFGIDVADSIQDIGNKNLEMMLLAKHGGGVGLSLIHISEPTRRS